ncbi:alpha/beta hydrolase [Paralcaligenes sp. KSB-10]|jgi:acetyl esterase/lipase|uniref:alpha/beta hydrolase n=1 Tax=Paralcaligenes sp. KSB-10 TaxID=2901142 RepID=UPI001E4D43A9|nr:alpha/beta hydrolase [Paralcaligenes sp. KSB-10]UHL63320.1 alpha/beta hydrolase [Paralcaligenes sp. KSB-10]
MGGLCFGAQFFSLAIELTVLRPVIYASIIVLLSLAALAVFSPLRLVNMLAWADVKSKVVKNLSYGNEMRQKLDIYIPAQSESAPNVVVFLYGGNWNSGSRGQYGFVGKALASRGIMAVVADYRLSPEVAYPVFIEDTAQAVSWTLKHIGEYGGNVGNVFVAGHSAGAYNAAMVALDPRWLAKLDASPAALRGWIGIAGPYDFLPIVAESIKLAFLYPNTPVDSQPVRHVTAAAPPTLLITGAADDVVDPERNSAGLAADLRAAHVPVQTIILEDVGHGLLVGAFAPLLRSFFPVLDEVSAFVSCISDTVRRKEDICVRS